MSEISVECQIRNAYMFSVINSYDDVYTESHTQMTKANGSCKYAGRRRRNYEKKVEGVHLLMKGETNSKQTKAFLPVHATRLGVKSGVCVYHDDE